MHKVELLVINLKYQVLEDVKNYFLNTATTGYPFTERVPCLLGPVGYPLFVETLQYTLEREEMW